MPTESEIAMGDRDPFKTAAGSEGNQDFSAFGSGNDPGDPFGEDQSSKRKLVLYSLLVLLLGAGAFYYFTMDDPGYELAEDEALDIDAGAPHKEVTIAPAKPSVPAQSTAPIKSSPPKEVVVTPSVVKPAPSIPKAMPVAPAKPSPPMVAKPPKKVPASIRPTLSLPPHGAVRNYDETANNAKFQWTGGPGAWIKFSRSPSMRPIEFKVWVNGNHYNFHRPYPGVWFWQVSNRSGSSQVRMFKVAPPIDRNLTVVSPKAGDTIASRGAVVRWIGDSNVTYYRVEISNKGWGKPNYRFATSGTQVRLSSIAAGSYDLRVGAFSEVSGRWEYSPPIDVSFQ